MKTSPSLASILRQDAQANLAALPRQPPPQVLCYSGAVTLGLLQTEGAGESRVSEGSECQSPTLISSPSNT